MKKTIKHEKLPLGSTKKRPIKRRQRLNFALYECRRVKHTNVPLRRMRGKNGKEIVEKINYQCLNAQKLYKNALINT